MQHSPLRGNVKTEKQPSPPFAGEAPKGGRGPSEEIWEGLVTLQKDVSLKSLWTREVWASLKMTRGGPPWEIREQGGKSGPRMKIGELRAAPDSRVILERTGRVTSFGF